MSQIFYMINLGYNYNNGYLIYIYILYKNQFIDFCDECKYKIKSIEINT